MRFIPPFSARGLVLVLIIMFALQLALLTAFFQYRSRTISSATQMFLASELIDIADLVATMDSYQRKTLVGLVNTPYANINFRETLPKREPVSFFERLIGVNTRRIDIRLPSGEYLSVESEKALEETYVFFGQIGLLILCFFLILSAVLLQARAALQPVHRFAEAAKRLSQDLHAPPMELTGSPDLKKAEIAINRMQTALQEQVAGWTKLIAGIGHDLRTFITRLTLRTEFILDQQQREKALRDLNLMTQVVNQSLELGKAQQARDSLEKVNLEELLPYVVEPFMETGEPCDTCRHSQSRC